MATKMVRVNTLAVAKRWLNQMKETYHESHHKKLGIWEKARLTCTAKSYGYTDATAYIVGLKFLGLAKTLNLACSFFS